MVTPKAPIALIIMDGCGIGNPNDPMNAIQGAKKPNLCQLWKSYPHSTLKASGEAVGLPCGQMGNSEVGHLNIGSGRIIYQELTRITKSIRTGDFFTNPVLTEIMNQARREEKPLHLMGLLSDGGVHSHNTHLYALLEMAKQANVSKVWIHLFLDGRDVAPQSGIRFIKELENILAQKGIGEIATVSGRYYAMDRDKRWERIEFAYNAIALAKGMKAKNAEEVMEKSYQRGDWDEFVKPTVIDGYTGLEAGSGVIFFNFRPDRARQLTHILTDPFFTEVKRTTGFIPIHMVTFTHYENNLPVKIAFESQKVTDTLGEVFAKKGFKQLRIAETEKYAHVTFFFNGGVETPNEGEDRILIPSPKVRTYDLQPSMSAKEVTEKLLEELNKEKYSLIILNFANGDMVGHTGSYDATVKAVKTVDACVGKITDQLLKMGGIALITADHGNAEEMQTPEGGPWTAHTTNLVPLFLVSNQYKEVKLKDGILADIAPTLLDLAGIEIPKAMTGKSLVER